MMMVSVSLAYFAVGSLKAMTPLLTASTPVMAVQPLAKARSNSQAEMPAVADISFGGVTTDTGWPPAAIDLNTPMAIMPSKQAIKR